MIDVELLNLQEAHETYSLAQGTLTQMVSSFIAKHKKRPAYILVADNAKLDQDECDTLEATGIQVMAHPKARLLAYLGPIGDKP